MSTPTKWEFQFLVNSSTTKNQDQPCLSALQNGMFVAVWTDSSDSKSDSSGRAIRCQMFNADRTMAGSEFLVHAMTGINQAQPKVVGLDNGRFVVTWTDYKPRSDDQFGSSVRGQIFNADGTPYRNEFHVNTTTEGLESKSVVTALSGGRFVVAWYEDWQSGGDMSFGSIRAQVFQQDGSKIGSEFVVNTTTSFTQDLPTITTLSDGRFVVSWQDGSQSGGDTTGTAIRAQIFTADGTKSGGEFLVNTSTTNAQNEPAIAALANGGFVVTWTDFSGMWTGLGNDISSSAVRAQVYDSSGMKSGGEILVNGTTLFDQKGSAVAGLKDGRFIVAWTDGSTSPDDTTYAVRAQVFEANGTKSGAEFLVPTVTSGNQIKPTICVLADGRVVIGWEDGSQTGGDTSGTAVHAQVFDPRESGVTLKGTRDGDQFHGTGFGDSMRGSKGGDELFGAGGDDRLLGEAGNDLLDGGDGEDRLDGGIGDDVLTGGDKADVFAFAPTYGLTRITDFEDGIDRIDLRRFGFSGMSEVKALAADVAGDVTLTFAPGSVLTIENITVAELGRADFIL